MQEGAVQELNLIIKADVQGSVEAAEDEIAKIHHDEVTVQVIHAGVGGIAASDVSLAAASNAIVVGFNVRPNAEAKAQAEREGVDIRTYRVIYQLTEDIQQALIGMLAPEQVEEILGEAEVRQIFKVSRLGTIAGCMVTQGVIQRGAQVRIVRDGTIVYDGRIDSLKRFQDDVREVAQGFECGLTIDGYNDLKEGDVLEVYTDPRGRPHRLARIRCQAPVYSRPGVEEVLIVLARGAQHDRVCGDRERLRRARRPAPATSVGSAATLPRPRRARARR